MYWLKMCSFFKLYFQVLYDSSGDGDVIGIAMVIVCDNSGGGFMLLIYGLVISDFISQPSQEGFYNDRAEEGGECVSLNGASIYGEWDGVAMYGHVVGVRSGEELFTFYHV